MLRILVTVAILSVAGAAMVVESRPAHGEQQSGMEAAGHWAFQPLAAVEPPPIVEGDRNWAKPAEAVRGSLSARATYSGAGNAQSAIDRFIDGPRRERGLADVGPAERTALLRRATFDLIGLPPAPEEIADFLADESPHAFARVVDRLLASPRYGERWGRHWLDVVRYADTAGDNADYPVPEARLYRDYVIDAFNADKPYDQFVREQIAGDLLAAEDSGDADLYRDQIIATGYLALARRYATAPYELWHLTLEDVIDTTGRAFLGLSLRCARCHDHKFDPVTQRDYYALYGIFNSTQFAWAGAEEFHSKNTPRQHFVPLMEQAEVEACTAEMHAAIERLTAGIAIAEAAKDSEQVAQIRSELSRLEQARKLDAPPDVEVAYAVREGTPADAHIQLRGEPANPGAVVPRGVPTFLEGFKCAAIPPHASGRAELAQWLTRADHPLTARVMVNRIWQWHFVRGLVATPSNFGLRGSPPTHPELLDWLAARLIDSGWSIKAMHREIMLSRTYQLASTDDAENRARDGDNRWYWRFDRRRLDAEAIRDAMLQVSGRLSLERPAAHPFPSVEKWTWTQHAPFKAVYPSEYRSVYLMTQRIQRHPYLALFDGPDANTSADVRTAAIVPSQALYLMNNPFVLAQSQGLATRLIGASANVRERVENATLLCWSRRPTEVEIERAGAYLERVAEELSSLSVPAEEIEHEAWSSYAHVLLASNEFMYVD